MNYYIYINTRKLNPNDCAAIAEYAKRLTAYCNIRLICKPAEVLDSLYAKISASGHACYYQVLSGTHTMRSEEFAATLEQHGIHGISSLYFFIGYPEISNSSATNIQPLYLSSMEISTGLTGVVLYEQIYRSYRILNHQPYHK